MCLPLSPYLTSLVPLSLLISLHSPGRLLSCSLPRSRPLGRLEATPAGAAHHRAAASSRHHHHLASPALSSLFHPSRLRKPDTPKLPDRCLPYVAGKPRPPSIVHAIASHRPSPYPLLVLSLFILVPRIAGEPLGHAIHVDR